MKLFGTCPLQCLLAAILFALSAACSRNSDIRDVSGEVKTRIPWTVEGGEYSLQEVLLKGVHSLYEFSGDYVDFYIYPAVKGKKIAGTKPKARFLKAQDIYVPQDSLTQQMTVIYAHMQRLAELDKELGVEHVNNWPRDVGVAVRYTKENGTYEVNNAFYDGQTDSMLIVPYTQENLPIPLNAGILAHEHFHSLYFKLVEKEVFKERLAVHGEELRTEILGKSSSPGKELSDQSYFHRALSRSLNEGLADFWAWIYTGDADFLAASLPSEKNARSLNTTENPSEFFRASLWKFWLDNNRNPDVVGESCLGQRVSYCLGSDYARVLKAFSGIVQETRNLTAAQARRLVGQAVLKALPLLRTDLLALKKADKKEQLFEPVQFFVMVQNSMTDLREEEKNYLESLVDNTLKPKVIIQPVVPVTEIIKDTNSKESVD